MSGLAVVWMAWAASPAWGQWTGGPSGPIYYNGGNVGIGTAAPESKLHVEGLSIFHMDDWGNNTILLRGQKAGAPYYWGEYGIIASYLGLTFGNTQTGTTLLHLGAGGGTSANSYLNPSAGNVGIGTTAPQYKLAVNGTIGAKDVIVTNTGWSDHVFRPGYRLRPLSEVSAFIQKHRHLPDIPAEAEVKEKGVSLGEIQAKLLAKIEELTLHAIRQDTENRQLREHMAQQEKSNQELRRRIAQLENRAAGR